MITRSSILPIPRVMALTFAGLMSLSIAGCSDDDNGVVADTTTDEDIGTDTTSSVEGINFDNFLEGSITGDITEVDCTLSDGSESRCYQFEVVGEPLDHAPGPYCPGLVSDTAEAGGKWLDNGIMYDLDGAFIAGLADFYGDPDWQLHDAQSGVINVTNTPESCLAAAQLNPPEEWWNYCIECTIEGVGGPVPILHTIPIVPVARAVTEELDNTFPGVSLNGVGLSFPADLAGILATYNIAALDDCGGHVNNAISYHYHAATGCWHEIDQSDDHAALIGYAMDGYAIHSMTNLDGGEPTDLDECRGHTDESRGYHYHVADPGENRFIGCFHGEVAEVEGGGGPGGPGGPPAAGG